MPLVPAKCPECGGNINIDPNKKAAVCEYCKQPFIVQEAIQNFNTTYNITNNVSNDIKADVVNVYESKNSDFVIEAGVLKEYKGEDTSVIIPNNVKEIGENCFSDMKHLKKVTIPKGVTEIDSNAFSSCSALEEIVIPDGVKKIGHAAFAGCAMLEEVTLPNSIISISRVSFYGCDKIKKLNYPKEFNIELIMDVFPKIFEKQIEDRRKSEHEKGRILACKELPEEIRNRRGGYKIKSFVGYDTNSFLGRNLAWYYSDEYLNIIYHFIISDDNPISTSELKNLNTGKWWNIFGNDFRGLYGHYYAYEGTYDEFIYMVYIKECFTSIEEVKEYIKIKNQEYLLDCKRKGICPYCGQQLSLFGFCKTSYCRGKY